MKTITVILISALIFLLFRKIESHSSTDRHKFNYPDWFEGAGRSADSALQFLSAAQADTELCSFIESQTGAVVRLNGKTMTSPREKLEVLLLMDLVKCYVILGYDPAKNDRRSIPIFLFYAKQQDKDIEITIDNLEVFRADCQASFTKIMDQVARSVKNSSDVFFVAEYLKHINKDMLAEYSRVLLSFGYSVAGAYGKVSDRDDKVLDRVFDLIKI